ncbi:hypothetical protein [Rhodohalobacter sp. 8-1]|uniref:hypothetical protein n=1 Tax=Rhodohalobacter sp. 8-1 TaxID=3131972 RepID=UPI0030EDB7AE
MWNKVFSILISIFIIITINSCTEERSGVIDVKFTTELTKDDLSMIKADLASQNIDLTYDHLEFDEDGKLKIISASIDYNDGHKGSFESRVLKPTDSPGFYRDFSKE